MGGCGVALRHLNQGCSFALPGHAFDEPLRRPKRRAVLLRDHRRCRVPGCRNSTFLDLHHIQLRSEGGRNGAESLVTVCGANHRALHRGKLNVEGSATAPRFPHADGSAYGLPIEPTAVDAYARVFDALRRLGFREAEVRAVLGTLRQDAALGGASIQQLLREALRQIRLRTPR